MKIVLLVGGVGGAKLAYGLKEILPPEDLTIVVNTGDDFWHYGLRICPDIDTITYTLANLIDPRNGWGIANDTRQTLQALKNYGEDAWFGLGDIDIGTHLLRTQMLREGHTLSQITDRLRVALGIEHVILPMTDGEVATIVDTEEYGELGFQNYFVRYRWQPTLKKLHYAGADEAAVPLEVRHAIERADAIIVGPSNPWLSIAPILAVHGMRNLLLGRNIPRIAVSPIVGGKAIKGPTAKIMNELNIPQSARSVANFYADVINGFVYDRQDYGLQIDGLETITTQTVMRSDYDKILLAQVILNWLVNWKKA